MSADLSDSAPGAQAMLDRARWECAANEGWRQAPDRTIAPTAPRSMEPGKVLDSRVVEMAGWRARRAIRLALHGR